MLGQDRVYHAFVLFRFDTARAVNDETSPFEQRKRRAHDGQLLQRHPGKIVGRESPAKVDPPSHHACICAGRIHENAIELFFHGRRMGFAPVMSNAASDRNAEALQVLLQRCYARGITVARLII